MSAFLELLRVGKTFPGAAAPALADVDLTVAPGEAVALVGESGSGKTTLLRLCNRLLEPSSGILRLEGQNLRELDPVTLRRSIGYVQQEGGLLPHWPMDRNVALVPRLLGWDPAARRERARELLELVGLPPTIFGERLPHQLSGGQRQRAAVARALAARPRLVLLDEPFGALDALTRARSQRLLQQIRRRLEPTLLLVTHDLEEALRLGDRVAVLRGGRLLRVASPGELLRDPGHEYVARLLALRPSAGSDGAAEPEAG